jgi:glycosyltransferase involved in cell wall biosynthesis
MEHVSNALLVRLGGDVESAAKILQDSYGVDKVIVRSLADIPRTSFARVAVVGEPPVDEIGYGLVPLLALRCWPERMVTIDTRTRSAHEYGFGHFFAHALRMSVTQLTASGGAVALQRMLAQALQVNGLPAVETTSTGLQRILYVRPHAGIPAGVGGSVTHAHEVIRALRRAGVTVEAVTSDPAIARTAAADPDPPCHWRTLKVARSLKAIPASAMLAVDLGIAFSARQAARRADVIYQRHARFSLSGALLSRLTGKPLFLEYNGSEVYTGTKWGQHTPLLGQLAVCERTALASATLIIVVAEASRAELIDMGVDPQRILLNPNGVDPGRFAQGGGHEIRRTLALADAELIGFVGSFGPWHGASVLARAFSILASRRPRARLLLIGDGPQRNEVTRILRADGLTDRAVFTGTLPPLEVPAYLDACDVLASPHVDLGGNVQFFGSPTKLFEYMASGKPIVASRLGQIGDVLDDGRSALLVAPGDVAELAGALEHCLANRGAANGLGAAARADAIKRHTWSDNAARLIDAYADLVSTGRAGNRS